MSSGLDKIIEEIQRQLLAVYTEVVLDHAQNPRNVGSIKDADGFASVTGPCGDTMEIWLRVGNETVSDVAFSTDGCGTTIAAGSMITEMAKSKAIIEALKITQQDVLDALGGLPEENMHCALLAVDTLKEAIKNYMASRDEPWKRAYGKH